MADRFVDVVLALSEFVDGDLVFSSHEEAGPVELGIKRARWQEWGCPVRLRVTIDTGAGL